MPRKAQGQEPRPETAAGGVSSHHYRELLWQTLTRQLLLYFIPLLLLAAFFHVQYRRLIRDSQRAHLMVIAEQQARTLDLHLRERLVNLGNLADDPVFARSCRSPATLAAALPRLRQTNPAFVDLGVVDAEGRLVAYEGPVKFPGPVSYASEAWFRRIAAESRASVITDVYLGLRGQPHFTIAVQRDTDQGPTISSSSWESSSWCAPARLSASNSPSNATRRSCPASWFTPPGSRPSASSQPALPTRSTTPSPSSPRKPAF